MISFETFKKMVVVEMEQRVGKGKVFLECITKNNDTKITGLMIREDDHNTSPIIYLENFYADLHEKTLTEIVEDMWELYQDKKLPSNIELSTFFRWEDARNRIVMKVVNYEYNEALLKTIPHNRFLDLAIVYYYIYDMNEDYEATIMVTNTHMHMWSVDLRELKEVAYENYRKFYEPCVKALDEIVKERMGVCADQLSVNGFIIVWKWNCVVSRKNHCLESFKTYSGGWHYCRWNDKRKYGCRVDCINGRSIY